MGPRSHDRGQPGLFRQVLGRHVGLINCSRTALLHLQGTNSPLMGIPARASKVNVTSLGDDRRVRSGENLDKKQSLVESTYETTEERS